MERSSKIRLNIETYFAGKNQPTHPSLVVFPNKWNGYRYWLAYSPYPYANGEEENPCIAVSNDLLYWDTPLGLANPIATNEETGCRELKDPHILYRADLDRLEMWYLGRLAEKLGGDGKTLLLFRKVSLDGVHWSNYQVMTTTNALSPSIIYKDGCYHLWEIGYNETKGHFYYRTSADGVTWSQSSFCTIDNTMDNLQLWHGAVSWDDKSKQYHFVFTRQSSKCKEIMHCASETGREFSSPEEIIKLDPFWESFYRPYIAFDDNSFICLYGVINSDNSWYLSMNIGSTLHHMKALPPESLSNMVSLPDVVCNTHSWKYIVKYEAKLAKQSLCIETFLSVPVLVGLQILYGQLPPWFLFFFCILSCVYFFGKRRNYLNKNAIFALRTTLSGILNGAIAIGLSLFITGLF